MRKLCFNVVFLLIGVSTGYAHVIVSDCDTTGLGEIMRSLRDLHQDSIGSVLEMTFRAMRIGGECSNSPIDPEMYYMRARAFEGLNQSDSAILYYQRAIEVAQEKLDFLVGGRSHKALGDLWFYQKKDPKTASGSYSHASSSFEQIQKEDEEAVQVLRMLAYTHRLLGNFTASWENAGRALELAELLSKDSLHGFVLNDLGIIYMENHEHEKADTFFQQSLSIFQNIGAIGLQAMLYNNMGRNLMLNGLVTGSLPLLRNANRLHHQVNQPCNAIYSSYNIGHALLLNDQLDSANAVLEETLENARVCEDIYIQVLSLTDLGIIAHSRGLNNKAINFLGESISFSQEMGLKKELMEGSRELYQIFKSNGNYGEALVYHELYLATKDSLFNEDNNRQIARLEAQYAFDQAKRSLEVEKEQQEIIYRSKLKQQRTYQIIAVVGLLISLVILGILNRYYQLKRKANEKLSVLNAELKEKTQQIVEAQDQLILNEKLASLGQVTAGIGHELKNPLNFVNNFSEGTLELLEDLRGRVRSLRDENPSSEYLEIDELIREIEMNTHDILSNGQRADAIASTMMHHAVDSSETWKYVNFEPYLTQQINLSYSTYRSSQNSLDVQLETSFESEIGFVELYPNEFAQAFRNILKNAFESLVQRNAEAEGDYFPKIQIAVERVNEFVRVTLIDNGLGISDDVKDDIFIPFYTGKGKTGLGLSIAHDVIVQRHQGRINVESEVAQYTKVMIDIPLKGGSQKTK